MSLFEQDYKSLYQLQDKVLEILIGHLGPFYLTGGTTLGRFYLNHRYSDDLDFFVNSNPTFGLEVKRIYERLINQILVDTKTTVFTKEYVRIWIGGDVKTVVFVSTKI
jgi:hypothetical protein